MLKYVQINTIYLYNIYYILQVQFNRALYNVGNHYDSVNSVFTCPVSGYYYFSVGVLVYKRASLQDTIYGSIYLGNSPQIRATAKGRNANNQVVQ
jgi:hypothetical protein